jgi:tRNA G37 N-methylase Trm5
MQGAASKVVCIEVNPDSATAFTATRMSCTVSHLAMIFRINYCIGWPRCCVQGAAFKVVCIEVNPDSAAAFKATQAALARSKPVSHTRLNASITACALECVIQISRATGSHHFAADAASLSKNSQELLSGLLLLRCTASHVF